jgi:hypothetical protein
MILIVISAEAGIQEPDGFSGLPLPAFAGTSLRLRKQVREWHIVL